MGRNILNEITSKVLTYRFAAGVYIIFALFATLQPFVYGKKVYESGAVYTYHNNYIIFKQSAAHLREGTNLYKPYPDEYWDLYKYSPTFAFLFSAPAALPDWAGLGLWNILNALLLFLAIKTLSINDEKRKILMLMILSIEMLTSLQSQQSNALMAALMILAFALMEKDKVFAATGLLVFSVYIKLFGLAGFVLFLFYPDKLKAAGYTLLWFLIFFALPLFVTGFDKLLEQYKNWGLMLLNDRQGSQGLSVAGWMDSWLGLHPSKNIVLLSGTILFLAPLLKIKRYKEQSFRMLMLASTLIWVVIFNHKAESPTFVIAMAGVVLWFFHKEKRDKTDIILLVLTFIFTSLSPTDMFPATVRHKIFEPYVVKMIFPFIIWVKILWETLKTKPAKQSPS